MTTSDDRLRAIDALTEQCDEIAARAGRLSTPQAPPLPATLAELKRRDEHADD